MQRTDDEERLQEYQNRVAAWIGNQGMFFQLRYAGIVGNYSLIKQFWNFFLKFLIVVAAAIGIGYLLLNRHFGSESYSEKISDQISEVLGAEDLKASGFSRARGQGSFRELEIEGGDKSFFIEADILALSGPFTFLAGVTEQWSPEEIRLRSATIQLKAGGKEAEMEEAFAGIIESFSGSKLSLVAIDSLNVDWGYSKLTYGTIVGTSFRADWVDGEWLISLSGGSFTQNWLKDLKLKSAEMVCGPEGLEIKSLDLELKGGTVSFSGNIGGSLGMPQFDLIGEFDSLSVDRLIRLTGIRIRQYLSGTISGNLNLKGSTNRVVTTDGRVELKAGNSLIIREQWPVLKMLSVLDINNTYRRVDFDSGSFNFSTADGGLKIENLDLRAGELMWLQGDIETRLPNQKEAADSLGVVLTEGFGKGVVNDVTDVSGAAALEDERISLKRAVNSGRLNDITMDLIEEDEATSGRKNVFLSAKELDEKRLRIAMSVHRVSGNLRLGVRDKAFSEYSSLQKIYPADEKGWRSIPLRFDTAFSKISSAEAEQLKKESRVSSPASAN